MKRIKMIAAIGAVLGVAVAALPAVPLSGADDAKKAAKKEARVIDPVCGMEVDPKTSEKSVFKGRPTTSVPGRKRRHSTKLRKSI